MTKKKTRDKQELEGKQVMGCELEEHGNGKKLMRDDVLTDYLEILT